MGRPHRRQYEGVLLCQPGFVARPRISWATRTSATTPSTSAEDAARLAALAPLTAAVDRAAAVLSPTEAAAVTRILRLAAEFLNRYAAGS